MYELLKVAISTISLISLIKFTVSWLQRPKLKLSPNRDPKIGGDEYYLRLEVQNMGEKPAKACVGRLLQIKINTGKPYTIQDAQGAIYVFPTPLDFCWEYHNQQQEPKPIDIPRDSKKHLDIVRCTADPNHIELRVNGHGQPYAGIKQDPDQQILRRLSIPAQTYHIKIGLYSEDRLKKQRWYALERSNTGFTIKGVSGWKVFSASLRQTFNKNGK